MNNASNEERIGSYRVKRKFLFLPLKLKNIRKWLIFAKIKQVLTTKTTTLYNLGGDPYMITKLKWVNIEFLNE